MRVRVAVLRGVGASARRGHRRPLVGCELDLADPDPGPGPGPGEVPVRVRAAGRCHSDPHRLDRSETDEGFERLARGDGLRQVVLV